MTTQTMRAELDVGGAVLELGWSSHSNVGNLRTLNEDSTFAVPPVFVVADGMGGHDGGEVASALAIGAIASLTELEVVERSDVIAAVETANRLIHERSGGGERGMGTTITGLVATRTAFPPAVTVLNVGDSRTYRLRGGLLEQLTVDHSHVQELIERGLLAPDAAAHHPERNVVTRALGIDVPVQVDTFDVAVVAGDRFMVCSDGLTGELTTEAMQVLLAEADPDAAAARLVERTLAGPARDNVSVIVIDVVRVIRSESEETTMPRGERQDHAANDTTAPNPLRTATVAQINDQLIDLVPVATVHVVMPRDASAGGHGAEIIDQVPFAAVDTLDAEAALAPVDERQ